MNDKKCPYCSAPLQENASFCMHCMKSLDQKTVIAKKRSQKRMILFVILLVLLAAATVFLIFWSLRGKSDKKMTVSSSETVSESENSTESDNNSSSTVTKPATGDIKKTSGKSSQSTGGSQNTSSNTSSAGKTTSGGTQSQTSSASSEKPADTPTHKHTFTAKTVKAATCGEDGEKLYTCSCGAKYTEKIAATGKHNYIAITKTVHHDEEGHYAEVQISAGYTIYICPQCHSEFNTYDAYHNHFYNIHVSADPLIAFIEDTYGHRNVPAQNETVWVVDKAAYDETVITGYKCDVCGKTK